MLVAILSLMFVSVVGSHALESQSRPFGVRIPVPEWKWPQGLESQLSKPFGVYIPNGLHFKANIAAGDEAKVETTIISKIPVGVESTSSSLGEEAAAMGFSEDGTVMAVSVSAFRAMLRKYIEEYEPGLAWNKEEVEKLLFALTNYPDSDVYLIRNIAAGEGSSVNVTVYFQREDPNPGSLEIGQCTLGGRFVERKEAVLEPDPEAVTGFRVARFRAYTIYDPNPCG